MPRALNDTGSRINRQIPKFRSDKNIVIAKWNLNTGKTESGIDILCYHIEQYGLHFAEEIFNSISLHKEHIFISNGTDGFF